LLIHELPGISVAQRRFRHDAASGSSPPEAAAILAGERVRATYSAVVLGVFLRCLFVVLGGMQGVSIRHLGMVGGFFMIAGFGVFCGFAMMLGRMLMMIRGHLMVFMNIVAVHRRLPVECLH